MFPEFSDVWLSNPEFMMFQEFSECPWCFTNSRNV
jgi:hypothetical protein